MAVKTLNTRIVIRNATAQEWTAANAVLLLGEMGIETDTRKFKFGDGTTHWVDLTYAGSEIDTDAVNSLIEAQQDNLYQYTRTNADQTDADAISAALDGNEAKQGDICVITTSIDSVNYEQSAFMFDGTQWAAMTGNVDADSVILREDITMAGSYTQVGNLTKTSNGTGTFSTKGKSVMDALTTIFTKTLQPTITSNPSVTLTFGQAKAYEVGTTVTPAYSASLKAGSYTYGPATGIVATSWEVTDTDGHSSTTASGSFDSFVVDDDTDYSITAKATYDAGAVANDNLGNASNPVVQIAAGSKSATSSKVSGYRSFFYGVLSTSSTEAPLTSAIVRGLTNGGAYTSSKTFTLNGSATAKRIVIAIPSNSTRSGLSEVILTSAMNTPVTESYAKTAAAVQVEGANGATAVDYDVWVYEPAAIDAGEVHKITLA